MVQKRGLSMVQKGGLSMVQLSVFQQIFFGKGAPRWYNEIFKKIIRFFFLLRLLSEIFDLFWGFLVLILGNNEFSEKGRLEGTMGKFCDFISEKGCLEGTSEIFEKNKVQREKWPVPSNGPPL